MVLIKDPLLLIKKSVMLNVIFQVKCDVECYICNSAEV